MQEELKILEVHSTVNYSIRAAGSGSNLTKALFFRFIYHFFGGHNPEFILRSNFKI